ncbi:Uu.00g105180.m01.CDS01 [Anthostomella pinea]|uniref:Uu.00g105180.m01.CDS01 n=1 Tax=Anthostomella pinea TaxID=933095 RepID=A0AAI8VEE3_9PEZI|nr:Uu.00g105180.m01.CDS01 [Anthostomella pinea]
MPLLYGEGDKAFRRLQAEILSSAHGHTLFLGYIGSDNGHDEKDTSGEPMRSLLHEVYHGKVDNIIVRPASTPGWIPEEITSCPEFPFKWESPQLTASGIHLNLPLKQHCLDIGAASSVFPEFVALSLLYPPNVPRQNIYLDAFTCLLPDS